MSTGMPSGRSLAGLPDFGMYTRRTGRGAQEQIVSCTRTAMSIRACEDSATCPSIPAVRRPVLRWVT